jgi:thiamine kinase-like enzyme
MGIEPLENLEALGVRWRLDADDGQFDPRGVLPWVLAILDELNGSCLVHGDLHAGNELLLDDRTPHLIDFAYAGDGHP